MPPCHGGGRRFKSDLGRQFAAVAQSVEQRTENPRVDSSILSCGTICFLCGSSSAVEHRLAKARVASSNLVFRSIRRHSQVVRQRSAKPLFPSSNLGAASTVLYISCRGGGTGRRKGLKIPRRVISVPVQFRSSAPKKHSEIKALQLLRGLDFCFSSSGFDYFLTT